MKELDFTCKHHILLEDEEGVRIPMDQPYFKAEAIAAGTWLIKSDGDFSYLLEGEEEALVIDSGYGAGNIREFSQTLTQKSVKDIVNTHDHFDHTANNGYFERAYMSAETRPLATRPFPSFSGIGFPRNYPVQIVDDGDMIPVKGRELLVFKIPDHAVGSIVLLDRRERILFSGDELGMAMGKPLRGSVENWAHLMEKLAAVRGEYDRIFGGFGEIDADIVEKYLKNARHILEGHEGTVTEPAPFPNFERKDEQGNLIWKRYLPHPGDGPKENADDGFLRCMDWAGCRIIYDSRKIIDDK